MGNPVPPPGAAAAIGWDLAFTRLAGAVQARLDLLVEGLTSRLNAAGRECDVQVRQTPRGVSTFLAVVGPRGLDFIVDMTLVDGMAVAGVPAASLDVRLLDACGDPAATCWPASSEGALTFQTTVDRILAWDDIGRCATSVCVLAMGHFDLVASTPWRGGKFVH